MQSPEELPEFSREGYASLQYQRLINHQDWCLKCRAHSLDPDGMCSDGRFKFHAWDRAERRASESVR